MTIRLIVSDLDGTLLSPEHQLTQPVKEAVAAFTKRGGLFTFATGRPLLTAASFERELTLGMPYILCNGSVIAQKGEVMESASFLAGDVNALLADASQADLDAFLFREDGVFVFRPSEAVHRYEEKERVRCIQLDEGDNEWKEAYVQKVILIGDMSVIRQVWALHEPVHARFAAFQSEADYWEIMSSGQSKGTALRKIAERLNIKREEIMALGNQLNDLDMLQYAGIGVAVANAHEELKAEADYVCKQSYGEGVLEAMAKFCL
ncbi:HAD family hydrolase [Paenibacillus sp. 1011MAR3C5]|uniref:HAD family hydrolase n=1 Tax=Paenibacillus sp. 1011MAR3C5 TaxID=1675787 RepID=UPI0021757891|nr:HAD family hydrolase [Paenibacillus sp. 1011MAR3C5]